VGLYRVQRYVQLVADLPQRQTSLARWAEITAR